MTHTRTAPTAPAAPTHYAPPAPALASLPDLTPEQILAELERAERAGFLDGCRVGRVSHFIWGLLAGAILVAACFNFGAPAS